jgi:bifunctional non-homologous end joining protein LigD
VPLAWDELDAKEDLRKRFNVLNVPERLAKLRKDPWADYAKTRQGITAKMKKTLGL